MRTLHEHGDALGALRFLHGRRGHGFGGRFGHGTGRAGFRRRGSSKYDILAVLAKGPRHGYDIMLEIESQSGVRPSAGSIYPALQMLEDGDFIRGRDADGKRIFEITDAGRAMLAERPEEEAGDEELAATFASGAMAVRGLIGAAKEAMRGGDPAQLKRVVEILERARREIYTLLAEAK